MHRRASDHWFAALRPASLRRFQCDSAACGWSGLLDPTATPANDRRRPLVAGALMALVVAAATVGLVAVTSDRWGPGSAADLVAAQRTAALRPQLPDAAVQVPPAGWHDVGQAIPSDDARHAGRAAGLQIRHGCTWGVPGRDPYRGTAEQALQAAGLPADAVSVIAQRIRRGESDGEVTLARDGIQTADGQRQFGRRMVASTYGMTLCFDTLVNFEEGHVERAPLFEFTSADGRRFSVIVPDVCGNVGVIDEQPSAGVVLGERAERTPTPVAPGTPSSPTTNVAPPQASGSYGAPMHAAAPGVRAGDRPTLPPPSMGSGGHVPSRGDSAAPQPTLPPVGPTLPATPEQPQTPPLSDPGPATQPPGNVDTPPPEHITPPQPPRPPTPPANPEPPTAPPMGNPGPGTPPPPTPQPQPPVGPTLPTSPEPPHTPPTTPEVPITPPPVEPPPWPPEPSEPHWPPPFEPPLEYDEPPPVFPADPEPPRQVPAPSTLSTGLLGLVALMLSRRWRRRRQG